MISLPVLGLEAMSAASAVILAGGRSSRMGLAKAALPFGASTMLEHLINTLSGTFGEVVVVVAPLLDEPFSIDRSFKQRVNLVVERDDSAFAGPVGALRRGMARARGELVFACSCDLPLLRSDLAKTLCAMVEGYDGVIPMIDGRIQPLCAAYRGERAVAALAAMEADDERRLSAIAGRLNARIIDETILRLIDTDLRSFLNVNTAQDYAQALRFAGESERVD
jgi:molybdopterin-guanine dinucleotide biosynthesis protein A